MQLVMLNGMTHDEYVPKRRLQNCTEPIYPKLSLLYHRVWTYFTINDLICSTAGSCPEIILLRVKSPKKDDSRSYSDRVPKQYCKVFRSFDFMMMASMVSDKMVWSHEHC